MRLHFRNHQSHRFPYRNLRKCQYPPLRSFPASQIPRRSLRFHSERNRIRANARRKTRFFIVVLHKIQADASTKRTLQTHFRAYQRIMKGCDRDRSQPPTIRTENRKRSVRIEIQKSRSNYAINSATDHVSRFFCVAASNRCMATLSKVILIFAPRTSFLRCSLLRPRVGTRTISLVPSASVST